MKVENLSHIYSKGTPFEKTAVDQVNLEIEQGEFVGVIGHTGSGKSTLIQHLNGLLKPTQGRVLINGRDIWAKGADIRRTRFEVGLVFQYPEYQLFEETVYKDIAFGPRNMGLSEEEIRDAVAYAVQFVGLKAKHMERSPFELSGGQKRRVAIAGVIAMRPQVLILDEPTAGLDPKGRDMILSQIKRYHEQTGSTVLLVSHSMEDIARYTTKLLVMNRSRVFAYDTPRSVFARADELSGLGLDVPQVTRVFSLLRQRGYDIADVPPLTIEEAGDEILRYLAHRKGNGTCSRT